MLICISTVVPCSQYWAGIAFILYAHSLAPVQKFCRTMHHVYLGEHMLAICIQGVERTARARQKVWGAREVAAASTHPPKRQRCACMSMGIVGFQGNPHLTGINLISITVLAA